MRDRIWWVLLVAVFALSLGFAVGWWVRGGDSDPRPAPIDAASAPRASAVGPGPTHDPRGAADRAESIATRDVDRDAVPGDARVGPPVPASPSAPGEADRDVDAIDPEQRARDRREDFEAFGDGPVARGPSADRTPSASGAQAECLPLGAAGCRRDLDCCGTGVCRTRAGQIAGFLECTEPR